MALLIRKFFIFLFFFLTLVLYTLGLKTTFVIWGLYSCLYFLYIFLSYNCSFNIREIYIHIVLFCFFPIILINSPNDSGVLLQYSITIISSIVSLAIIKKYYDDIYIILKISIYSLSILLITYILIIGFDNFPSELPIEKILLNSSSNGVTTLFVILNFIYQIFRFRRSKTPDHFFSILVLLISLAGYGRGAILASVLQLIGGLIISLNTSLSYKHIILVISLIIITTYFYEDIDRFITANTKIGSGLEDNERDLIFKDYTSMNIKDFLLGKSYENTVILIRDRGNPHNSFIRIHHMYGILGIIYFMFLLIWSMLLKSSTQKSLIILVFYGSSIILRIFTEIIFLGTIMDFFFFMLIYDKINFNETSL